MPKDRRVNSSSFERARVSPYAGSSKISDPRKSKRYLPHAGDEAEWEESRCPICMEHPHNAVMLLCSSRDKGCRPFMCDTSSRHSNCLDQFRKSSNDSSPNPPINTPQDDISARTTNHRRQRGQQLLPRQMIEMNLCQGQQPVLVCPLCRGQITGWLVIEPARIFMNSKTRNCSSENCDFSGNYSELRKHARIEHPFDKPSEASSQRQSEWRRLEQQSAIEDAFSSAYQQDSDYDWDHYVDELPSLDEWDADGLWNDWNFFDFHSGLSDIDDYEIDDHDLQSGGDVRIPDLEFEFSFSFLEYQSHPVIEMTDIGDATINESVRERRRVNSRSNYRRSNSDRGNVAPSSSSRSSYNVGNSPANSRPTYRRRYTQPTRGSMSGDRRADRAPTRPRTSRRQPPSSARHFQSSWRS